MEEQIAYLLRYAILAPSSHDCQPWRFSVVQNRVGNPAQIFQIAEKNLDRHNDRERRNNHHCKRQRHEPYPAKRPPKNCTDVEATPPEKPATRNYENEQQQHAVSNPYRHKLAEGEDMFKNDKDQHDGRENKINLYFHYRL